jgi:hypothetical protein
MYNTTQYQYGSATQLFKSRGRDIVASFMHLCSITSQRDVLQHHKVQHLRRLFDRLRILAAHHKRPQTISVVVQDKFDAPGKSVSHHDTD